MAAATVTQPHHCYRAAAADRSFNCSLFPNNTSNCCNATLTLRIRVTCTTAVPTSAVLAAAVVALVDSRGGSALNHCISVPSCALRSE